MKEVDVKKVDWHRVYLHYTDKNNLSNIAKNGLIPAIGDNSKGIEKTPKIFFTISFKGALAIMDV